MVHFIIILSLRKFITGLTLTIVFLCWWYHIKYREDNTILNPNSTETREWSPWEHLNACIGTCGHGTQSRRRVCINDRYYECNRETDVHLRDLCSKAFFPTINVLMSELLNQGHAIVGNVLVSDQFKVSYTNYI